MTVHILLAWHGLLHVLLFSWNSKEWFFELFAVLTSTECGMPDRVI